MKHFGKQHTVNSEESIKHSRDLKAVTFDFVNKN